MQMQEYVSKFIALKCVLTQVLYFVVNVCIDVR